MGGVAYTRGSVGTRWIWSAHIGVALSWRHWACVETNGYGGGEQGYDDRGWYPCVFWFRGSCIHSGKCRDAMDIERTHRRCTFVASLDLRRDETRQNGYVRSVGQRYTTGRIIGKVYAYIVDISLSFSEKKQANIEKYIAISIHTPTCDCSG